MRLFYIDLFYWRVAFSIMAVYVAYYVCWKMEWPSEEEYDFIDLERQRDAELEAEACDWGRATKEASDGRDG